MCRLSCNGPVRRCRSPAAAGTGQAPPYGAADGLRASRPSASSRELLRASTPADSGVAPDLVVGDRAQLFLDGTGGPGPAALRIVLNSRVIWRLVFTGGASSATIGNLTYTGVAGGTMLTMPGWASALRRYDIDAPAGVSAISVTSR
jgi:hypothetical protein